jgi:hypothetical protein
MTKIKCPINSCRNKDKVYTDPVYLADHINEEHPSYEVATMHAQILFKMIVKIDELEKEFVRSEAYAINNGDIRIGYSMIIDELKKLLGAALVKHS